MFKKLHAILLSLDQEKLENSNRITYIYSRGSIVLASVVRVFYKFEILGIKSVGSLLMNKT